MKHTNDFLQLLTYTSPRRSKIIFASICSALNKICDIVPEILIGISINTIVEQEDSLVATQCGIQDPFQQLYLIGSIAALAWILESFFEYCSSIAWRTIAQEIQHELRLKTYEVIQNLDDAYIEKITTQGLLTLLQDDINQLEQFLSQGFDDIIQLVINILAMGSLFFYLSPKLALLTLLPAPFIMLIAHYFQHKLAHLYEILRQTASNLAGHIVYKIHGLATIRSFATQSYELEQLQTQSNLFKKANNDANRTNALYIPSVRMAIMVGFIISLVTGGIYALEGSIPLNWYAALVFLTQRFLWPFATLATITDRYQKSAACAHRIVQILKSTSQIQQGSISLENKVMQGTIIFKNINFCYTDGIDIFNNLSLTIPAKNTVAFVGATGSGKSTLVQLLLRFYDPQSGSIHIDDYTISDLQLNALRRSIGLVSQDLYLIKGTIAQNIAYGSFHASDDEIIESATMAQAHDFIVALPDGYQTLIEEHGKNLSGGQRQRIAIARALLKKSPILIFDEATSAIDNQTEAALLESILHLKHHHTILVIAHRLSTVRHADIIYVLDQGSIVESGTHEELVALNKMYANLWNTQLN